MTNRVYIAVSLDGFIAEHDGGLDWLNNLPNPEQSDHGFFVFMNEIDALVMGRKTFETVVTFDEWIYTKPVFVWSSTLENIPDVLKNKVQIISGEARDVVDLLNSKGFEHLYVDGGKTIQAFLQADLIDEMVITTVSIILGGGIPLFGNIGVVRKFKLEKVEMLNENLAKQYYSRCIPS